MSNGALPPAAEADDNGKRKRMNGKSNGTIVEAGWKLVTALTLAGVVAVATMLWNLNSRIAVMEATVVTETELRTTLREEVPAPWFREQVTQIQEDLREHIRQSAAQAHGRSGGNGNGNGSDGP